MFRATKASAATPVADVSSEVNGMRESDMSMQRALGLAAGVLLVAVGVFLLFHDSGAVIVSWETASEVSTTGFNVFRAEGSETGPFEQVNDELIPAQGDPLTGAAYRIQDAAVVPGRLYFYQIEEVEWTGARQRYPEVVQVRAGLPQSLLIGEGVVLIILGCALLFWQIRQMIHHST
jgi:hypothetical protein